MLNGKISHVSKKSTQFIEKIDTLIWTKIEILTLFPWICQACKNVFRSRTSSQIKKKYDLTEKRDASNFTVNVIFFLRKNVMFFHDLFISLLFQSKELNNLVKKFERKKLVFSKLVVEKDYLDFNHHMWTLILQKTFIILSEPW